MRVALVLLAGLSIVGCKKDEGAAAGSGTWTDKVNTGADLFATVKTNMGPITVKLFSKDAPKTVKNFVGLSTGEREWKNPPVR